MFPEDFPALILDFVEGILVGVPCTSRVGDVETRIRSYWFEDSCVGEAVMPGWWSTVEVAPACFCGPAQADRLAISTAITRITPPLASRSGLRGYPKKRFF